MKKLFVLAALSLLLCTQASVSADPFLVADPQTDASSYRMRLSTNGTTWGTWTQGPPVANAMRFDLGPITPGSYLGEAQAGAVVSVTDTTTGQTTTSQLWSASAPFGLSVPTIKTPTHVAVQPPTTAGAGN